MVCNFDLRLPFTVYFELRGPGKLFKRSQGDKLSVLILVFQSLLDLVESLRPLFRDEIMLSNIINYVLDY